jgi:lysyl-tRNA synthetase class 1
MPAPTRPAQAYWADEIAGQVDGRQVVNDSKTPSGTVHVGSLRGVVLHDAVRRAVAEHGTEVEFRYGIEDLDPMDAQSLLTPDAVEQYMGVPLAHVPAPNGSPHPNYARHFATLFLETFADLGIHPRLYWMSENYMSGAMDSYMERALDRAEVILEIYRTVSTVNHPAGWLPISVICENCGKIGTTAARDWNGTDVAYDCQPDHVDWARGCGFSGRVSPFSGRAKMVWNVDWAARWGLVGATIEGCGKDLATAGGSRDRADAIARRVFDHEPPLNIPYEFLNIAGRKMSTSRGEGAAAHEIAEILPPTLTRFLFLRHRPNKAIEFDPSGDTIPRLFDEFDRIADAVGGKPQRGELPPNPERIFALSLVDADADMDAEARRFRPAFAHLALLLQVPGPDIMERLAAEKGSALDESEQDVALERIASAEKWLETLAPETAKLSVDYESLPVAANEVGEPQRRYLGALADSAEQQSPVGGEAWQSLIFDTARALELKPGEAFAAIYRAFLGRPNGPRAGWLLASLPAPFVVRRLREAAAAGGQQ